MVNRELYQKIKEQVGKKQISLYTVLDGEHKGEKVLFAEEKMIWKTDSSTFLEAQYENICGESGTMITLKEGKVFKEEIEGERNLVICGAGHVSIPIIRMAKEIGFHVTVIEDRPLFANHARAAGADEVICENFTDALSKNPGGVDSYFVIVTRGHRYDRECLQSILRKPYAYVGMMGSRRRVQTVKEQLKAEFAGEQLDTLHAPIGLKIDAETPAEIAISIMAEIIQIKAKNKKQGHYDREILQTLLGEEEKNSPKILATIIERKGSAPRSVGTKMVIHVDGRTVGTIGGGCMEFEVVQQALLLLKQKRTESVLTEVDMTAESAEDEGMVCGGRIKVLLEVIE